MTSEANITTAEAIARVLKEEGVEYIFGVMGDGVFPMMLEASQQGIRVVHVRHEQAAAFAADAYALCTRKPGVGCFFGGPGYTNASNGIAQAFYSKSPMVVFVTQHPTVYDLQGAQASADAAESCRSITKWSTRVIDDRIAAFATKRAFAEATSYPPGPALVEIPSNLVVQRRNPKEQRGYLPNAVTNQSSGGGCDPQSIERAVKMLLQAQRPVVVGGELIYWGDAAQELQDFVEAIESPVITRRIARGAVSEDHPLAFGGRARGKILGEADVALLIGLSLGYLEGYGRWCRGIRFIQLQKSERELQTSINTELALVGNPKTILRQMKECAQYLIKEHPDRTTWLKTVDRIKQAEEKRLSHDAENTKDAKPIHPSYLADQILQTLEDDATIIFDAYTGTAFLTERVKAKKPGLVLDTGGWNTVGHGVGMGIGAQIARPGKQVFVMMGDGGIGIGGFDVETAVRCRLPVVYLIFNNSSWLNASVELYYGERFLLQDGSWGNPMLLTPDVRYDRLFETLGCHTEHVEEPAQIRPSLERSFASGKTSVINVVVDRNVFHPLTLRSGRDQRWQDPAKMPEAGRSYAFPELYQE